jgi:hypothetical protein
METGKDRQIKHDEERPTGCFTRGDQALEVSWTMGQLNIYLEETYND